MTNSLSMSLIEDQSIPEPNSGCWFWLGSLNNAGYGRISIGGKSTLTHRVSWQVRNGPIPDGLFILHRCDIPCCVNPDHLFLGTAKDNMTDCSRKGRLVVPFARGVDLPFAKLTETDVKAIRLSSESGRQLSKIYGIDQRTINRIKARKTWKHV